MRQPPENIPKRFYRLLQRAKHRSITLPLAHAILLSAALFGLGVALSSLLTASSISEQERLERENARLSWKVDQLKKRVADAESKLTLQTEQLRQQKKEIATREQEMQPLKKRLSMLESILAKRREKGIHLLAGSSQWVDDGLELNLVLVKGGNYPREIDGHIEVLALRPDDMVEALRFKDNRKAITFRIRTHALVHEVIPWQKSWRPKQLVIVLRDHHERELARMSIWVQHPAVPAMEERHS
ncbi:MAG: hypothetical protein D6703_02855 [Zetaproteobacteria bacterium]|nr:MAG: hypothetical protein D6703_02855 [Zetaproteobacteria bacterium]